MKNNQVSIGKIYAVKVSGMITPVKLESDSPYGGWNGVNLRTGRDVRIRTAAKLRYELESIPNGFRKMGTTVTVPTMTTNYSGYDKGDL